MKNQDYKNISAITKKLNKHDVPFIFSNWQDGYKLTFSWCDGDVISTEFSFHTCESYRFPWDKDDTTRLDPKKMAGRIINYYYVIKESEE